MINNNFRFFVTVSAFAHLLIAIILILGLPSFKRLPDEQVITFEVLPVSDFTNIKTQKVQKDKAIESEDAKEVKRASQESAAKEQEQPKPAPVPEPEAPKPTPAPEKPVEKSPELIKSDTAEPIKKDPEPKPEVKEEAKPKPEVKKEPPKEVKKKNKDADIDSLLKTLEKASEGKAAKSRKEARSEQSDDAFDAKGVFDAEMPIAISEHQAIKQQIQRNWNVPAGARHLDGIIITLYIALKPDGAVMEARFVSKECPAGNDMVCQAMVDSAIRAVHQASPFQNLSASQYNFWKAFNIAVSPPQ
jgi:outer membrane biosynthesis protein TonB